jgi:hypothetical protein
MVDMYYYQDQKGGTVFATQELISLNGENPIPNKLGVYELVALTKLQFSDSEHIKNPFRKIERRICETFTGIGNFSYQAKLEPGDTCELPVEKKSNRYLIFDEYKDVRKKFSVDGQGDCSAQLNKSANSSANANTNGLCSFVLSKYRPSFNQ